MMNYNPPSSGIYTCDSADIAIVGIGCRYPGAANTPRQLWEMLSAGRDGFSTIPESRWSTSRHVDTDPKTPARMFTEEAAFLDDKFIFEFDASFFGYSTREADAVDPQQRLLHEVSWECLEDAGIPASDLRGKKVGVYVGAFTADNLLLRNWPENLAIGNQAAAYSSPFTMLSNRLSYFFDFHGPSLTIDTACSASMVAFNYACQDLWSGRSDAAIVAGVSAMLIPNFSIAMSKGGFLSIDGRSKTFDAKANGYARGEGAGSVLIKKLSDALADGDEIYAVVKGTGVNQDGKTNGISAPNGAEQEALVNTVFEEFNLERNDVVLLEAHGTGTAVGDPTEISALAGALGQRANDGDRLITSIKGNIGHQEGGAGIAGIIKAALCLKYGSVPKQCNFETLNPLLDMEGGGFSVVTETTELPETKGQALASINAFGYGGTNAHVVLGQWQSLVENMGGNKGQSKTDELSSNIGPENVQPCLIPISARNEDAMKQRIADLHEYITAAPHNFSDIAYALQNKVDHHDYRIAFPAANTDEIVEVLEELTSKDDIPLNIENGWVANPAKGVVFVFTGMGPQWWAMGRELYTQNEIFRNAIEEAAAAFENHSGWSILSELLKDEDDTRMTSNEVAQPANFVLQYAITKLLASHGLEPDVIVGHSVGEVGASLAAGALDLNDAAFVAFHRSRLQQTKAGEGRMLATGLDIEMAEEIVELYNGTVSIGAINSATSIALSGEHDDLENISEELNENDIFAKFVFGEVAYHSHQMDSLEQDVLTALEAISPSQPHTTLYSTVTGERIEDAVHDAVYWWQNIRQPVQLKTAIQKIRDDGYRHFIEIGPNSVLSGAIQQIFAAETTERPVVVPSLMRHQDEQEILFRSLAQLWCSGVLLDRPALENYTPVELPHYPWQRVLHWSETKKSKIYRLGINKHPLSGVKLHEPNPTWEANLDSQTLGLLSDHVIDGKAIFPAAAYAETFLSAALQTLPQEQCSLSDINFGAFLPLPKNDTLQIRTTLADHQLTFHARTVVGDGDWKKYASARLLQKSISEDAVNLNEFEDIHLGRTIDKASIYDSFQGVALNYGPAFEVIEQATVKNDKVYAELKITSDQPKLAQVHIQPAILDGALQMMALLAPNETQTFLPVSISQLHLLRAEIPSHLRAYAKRMSHSKLVLRADIILTDMENTPVAVIKDARAHAVPNALPENETADKYRLTWREFDIEKAHAPIDSAQTLGPDSSFKKALADCFSEPQETIRNHYTLWGSSCRSDAAPSYIQAVKLVEIARELAEETNASLIICTEKVWRVNPEDIGHPSHADLWGVARSLRRELPNLNIICVDFDGAENQFSQFKEVLGSLESGGEFAFRGDGIWQRHLVPVDENNEAETIKVPYHDEIGAFLDQSGRVGIDSLDFRTQTRRKPIGGEIEVLFDNVSLNFKDVLKIFNRLTIKAMEGSFSGDGFGLEAHGIVIRSGPDSEIAVGESVICGIEGGCFSRYATISYDTAMIYRVSDLEISPAEKSTMLVAYSTAHYGLLNAAHLKKGETVLLHSATGGVGHAAIQVARAVGAEIIATAGTEEKRQYLRDLGLKLVFDSRSLDFEQQILAATQGTGVDVVLNFLPDDLLHSSVRLLSSFGRLVEIGKFDIGLNKGLPLGEFDRNLSFISFDYDNLIKMRRPLAYELADEIIELFRTGTYQPADYKAYAAKNIRDGFRELAEGNHIGKRVINLAQASEHVLPPLSGAGDISSGAAYLVTGAYGGVGLETVGWLIDEGAGAVILSGRTIRESPALDLIKEKAAAQSCKLIEVAADIGNQDAVDTLISDNYPLPLRGVFHTAAVLADALIDGQGEETFKTAYYAKAGGAFNLHTASLKHELDLDYFVLFSSISATLGNQGQINYAGANSYLDALADHRRQLGLPAVSIAWGAIGGVGMVAHNEGVERVLAARGISAIPIKDALAKMKVSLRNSSENFCVLDIDWTKWAATGQISESEPAFNLIANEANNDGDESLQGKLATMSKEEGVLAIQDFIVSELAKALRLEKNKVRPDQTLSNLGLDSLLAVEVQIGLESGLKGLVSPEMMDMQKSISAIANLLYQQAVIAQEDEADEIDLVPAAAKSAEMGPQGEEVEENNDG
jgi:acyl transferase domain-containing protein/NADPH:quinone reductase-like Zn-dependent oxidoreductase/NAD(P)-dependent dehydrogenase (short-subunit alcohol dehydrogenase family)/acyl carrier protein